MYFILLSFQFGGTDGMKGDLARINEIPFGADGVPNNTYWGTGFTPEGIDQNPVYYEFMTVRGSVCAHREL